MLARKPEIDVMLTTAPPPCFSMTGAQACVQRNGPVRFAAIEFTLSVRSFHVPATPFTSAWPPSLPSVPTSRATRVTSDANDES